MKKDMIFKIILAFVTLVMAIMLVFKFDNKITKDSYNFKKEYEELNNKDNNGKKYLEIKIPYENNIKYLNIDEVIDFLNNKTGIIYFGFPSCPWCRNIINPLIEVAKEKKQIIYYFNALSIRDTKELKDGKVITTKNGTKDYYEILDKLDIFASTYKGLNDESIKRLYFPTVVFVKNGKVVASHSSTVTSQKDPYKAMNNEQIKELKNIYLNSIDKLNNGMCTNEC